MRGLAALLLTTVAAHAAEPTGAEADAGRFLAANVEWVLDHAMAHALVGAFDLAVEGPPEDAADAFASASVSARHEEGEAAERLALVAEAWSRAAARPEGPPTYFVAHDLDPARAFRVLCVANGADAAVAAAALPLADVPDGGFDACEVDRDLATETWDVALGPNMLFDDEPPADVTVSYGEAAGFEAERAALEATGALEALAEEVARSYALFEPLTIEARGCGGSEGDPSGENAIVLCYELVADLMALGEAEGAAENGADGRMAGGGAADEGRDATR